MWDIDVFWTHFLCLKKGKLRVVELSSKKTPKIHLLQNISACRGVKNQGLSNKSELCLSTKSDYGDLTVNIGNRSISSRVRNIYFWIEINIENQPWPDLGYKSFSYKALSQKKNYKADLALIIFFVFYVF